MNVSGITVTGLHLFLAIGPAAGPAVVADIEAKLKKKISVSTEMQFGQIMSLLFPSQMANLLFLLDHEKEASLISEWFMVDGYDVSGMLNIIPGAWGTDRIVKHICKTESVYFTWVDETAYHEGCRRFYSNDMPFDRELYSQPLSRQFSKKLLDEVMTRMKAA